MTNNQINQANQVENKKELCAMLSEIILVTRLTVKDLTEGTTSVQQAAEKGLTVLIEEATKLAIAGKEKEAHKLTEVFVKYSSNIKSCLFSLANVYTVYKYLHSKDNTSLQVTSASHTCDTVHAMDVVGSQIMVSYNGTQKMTWDSQSKHYSFKVVGSGVLTVDKDEKAISKNARQSFLDDIVSFVSENIAKVQHYVTVNHYSLNLAKKAYAIYLDNGLVNEHSLSSLAEIVVKSKYEMDCLVNIK